MRTSPRPRAARRALFVPVCGLGLGTGNAWILDRLTRERHLIPAVGLALVDRVACVRLRPTGCRDRRRGLHLVELPGGNHAWVRIAATGPDAAGGW